VTELDFLVTRRGVDPAAETAAMALTDLLATPVAGVERGELWRFTLAPGAQVAPARAALERAACRAGRYVNTNRDIWTWLDAPRPYPAAAPRGGTAVDIWVTDGDGRDPVAARDFGAEVSDLRDVRRGILWRLWLPVDAQAAADLAWSIAETRARRQGLLFNPHAQKAEILAVVAAPLEGPS
jgi:hypothetical protein